MFKVKRIKDGEIFQVLDTYIDDMYGITYFFLWDNDGWHWRAAKNYCPPNYEIKKYDGSTWKGIKDG